MRTFLAMAVGKSFRFLIRLVRRGGGSALPGTLAFKIQPRLLKDAIDSLPHGLVVISGTAGKSSSTKILVELLRAHGLKVFTNPSTANIRQGFFAAILQFGDLRGRIDADIAVMEWDEGHGAVFSETLKPKLALLTNVLSDQLDRFVDPVFVQEKLRTIAENSLMVVANRDDKNLCQFLEGRDNTFGLGLSGASFDSRPEYAINFGPHPVLSSDALVLAAGKDGLELKLGAQIMTISGDYSNLSQALNVAGAVLAASKLVALDLALTKRTIESLPPVFARDEIASIRGREVRLMLVQNPTSFQLNIEKFAEQPSPLMMMAGRDIHDPSWLWTVDFSNVKHVDIVSGFNANELSLRLHYAGVVVSNVIPEIDKANELFASMEGPTPTIVFSADAMRRTRRYLGLAK